MEPVAGIIFFKVDGALHQAKGDFTYGLGTEKREAAVGTTAVAGFKESVQVAFVEGEIYDSFELSLRELAAITDATVTLELANGKVISQAHSWYAGDGTGNTGEGNIGVRFEAAKGEEIR